MLQKLQHYHDLSCKFAAHVLKSIAGDYMSLGETLRALRNKADKSQKDVMKETGIYDSYLSKYENDAVEISWNHLRVLAAYYKVNPIKLMLEAGYFTEYDMAEYSRCFDRVELLSQDEIVAIQHIIYLLTTNKKAEENVK